VAENFQDVVAYGLSSLAISGDAIIVGATNTNATSKTVFFNNNSTSGALVWGPSANRTISLPDASGVIQLTSQGILSLSAGGAQITSGQVIFSNSNGVSFGANGQTVTGSVATSLTNINVSAGTTSNNLSAVVFSNSNNVSFGLNGSTVTATISVPAQTNQTVGLYGLGNTTQNSSTTLDARTLSFNGLGGITVGYSNGSIQLSGPQTVAQTNQTVGLYGLGNTTQNSSTTLDARTLSFNGLGGITVGYSNGSIQLSGPVAQTNQTVGLYALGNTTQNSSTTLDARTLSFNGLGIVTVGYSNGSIQISATQSNQTEGLYAIGNTAGQSSSSTFDARTMSISGVGAVSVGYSGNALVISAPPFAVSRMQWPDFPWQTNFSLSNMSQSFQVFNPKANITASQANFLMGLSGNTNSTGALTISFGIYTWLHSTLSLASSSSRQITWTSGSQSTNSTVYGGISGTMYRTVALNNWAISAGDYMLGVWFRTTNNGTWVAFGAQGPTIVNAQDVNETQAYLNGYTISSYSSAMIASVNITDTGYARTGGDALKQPSMILLGSY
jgi:hypothetical protein